MPVSWSYAALYFMGIFLLARGLHQQEMPPVSLVVFGVGIICGAACIQLSEKK